MQISETNDFTNAKWVSFAETYSWTLSVGNGKRSIYVRFKDALGNTSDPVSDTITLEASNTTSATQPQGISLPTTSGTGSSLGSTGGVSSTGSAGGYVFRRNFGLGAEGADVVELQKILQWIGFFTNPTITGYYGAVTETAVKRYQMTLGISPTGFVGPLTLQKLNSGGGRTMTFVNKPPEEELDIAGLIRLFLALGIIPQEKAEVAYAALKLL